MEAAEERWQIAAAAEAAATKCESTSKRELTLETGNMVLYRPDQVGKRAAAEKTATGLDLEESLKATNKQGHGDAMDPGQYDRRDLRKQRDASVQPPWQILQ
jgi:hypothetical protein